MPLLNGGDYWAGEFGYIRQDGQGDDGPKINQALAYISAQGGGRLILNAGCTVQINTSILMPSNTELVIPTGTTLKAGAGISGPILQNQDQTNGNTNLTVSGFGIIDGNRSGVTSSASDCINFVKCNGAYITGPVIQNAYRDGIQCSSSDRLIIQPEACINNGRDGIRLLTCTFALFNVVAENNGQRISGNGVSLGNTTTDCSGHINATDNQGSPTQQYGIQELTSNCNRNDFVGSCNGNVVAGSSFLGASSQLFTQPSLSSPTLTTPTIAGAAQTTDGTLGYASHILSIGDGTINRPLGAYKIAETILGAPAASIDVSSIAGSYRGILLHLQGRSAQAVQLATLQLRLNNDSSGNYDYAYFTLQDTITTVGSSNGYAQTSANLGQICGGNAPANVASSVEIFIPNYSATTFYKAIQASIGSEAAASSGNFYGFIGKAIWKSTAAINEITLLVGGANFVAGTTLTIYGVP